MAQEVAVEQYIGTDQEALDAQIDSFLQKSLANEGVVSPSKAMSAIEMSLLAEENTEARGEDSNGVFMNSLSEFISSAKNGGDPKVDGKDLTKEAAGLDNAVLADELDKIIVDPTVPHQDKVNMANGSKVLSSDMNRMFSDASIAKKSHIDNEVGKFLENPPVDRSLWDKLGPDQIFGDIEDPKARDRAWEGAVDSYLENVLFPFQWVGAAIEDIAVGTYNSLTGDRSDEKYWKNAKETWEELQVWQAYRAHRSELDPDGYAKGGSHGLAWSFIFDPAAAVMIKIAGFTARATFEVAKVSKTVSRLEKAIGKTETARLLSLSHKKLAQTLQKDKELSKAVEDIARKGKNKLAKRLDGALVESKGKEVIEAEVEMSSAPLADFTQQAVQTGDEAAINNSKRMVLTANQPTVENVEAFKKAMGTGENTHLTLLGVDPAKTTTHSTDTSVILNNASKFKKVSDGIQYDQMMKAQEIVEGIHSHRVVRAMDDIKNFSGGITPGTWTKQSTNKLIRAMLPYTSSLKGALKKEIVHGVSFADDMAKVLKGALGDMNSAVWKGLSKKETKKLNDMCRAANDYESWGNIVDNVLQIRNNAGDVVYKEVLSPKLADRYVARKRMMGYSKDLYNMSANLQARSKGFKLFNGRSLAKAIDQKTVGGEVLEGFDLSGREVAVKGTDHPFSIYRVEGTEGDSHLLFLTKDQVSSKIKEIPYNHDMLGELTQEGFMPIDYPDKFILHEIVYESDKVTGPAVKDARPQAQLIKESGEKKTHLKRLQERIKLGEEAGEDVSELASEYNKVANELKQIQTTLRLKTSTIALDVADQGKSGLPPFTVKPIATANTSREAELYIAKAEEEGRIVSAYRAEPGQIDSAYSSSFMGEFFRLDAEGVKNLVRGMSKSGVDQGVVDDLLSLHYKYSKNPEPFKMSPHLMARAEDRLKSIKDGIEAPANIRVAKEADALYVDWVANYAGKTPYVEDLISKFTKEYGEELGALTDRTDWLSPIKARGTIPHKLRDEATAIQNQLKAITGRKSAMATAADEATSAMADYVLGAKFMQGKTLSTVGEFVDNSFRPSKMVQGLGQLTTAAKLGSLNLRQFPLQSSFGIITSTSASLGNIVSKNPILHTKALALGLKDVSSASLDVLKLSTKDFMESLSPMMWKDSFSTTKVGSESFDFLRRAGVLEGIDFEDYGRQLSNIRKNNTWVGGHVRSISKKAGFAFEHGEKLSQAYALLLSRRTIEAEIKAGKHSLLTVEDLLNGGSTRFLYEAKTRGETLAMNMARYNEPGFARNPITKYPLKFKNFMSHASGIYFDPIFAKDLKFREVAAIWLGTTAVLGPKGVPFLWDLMLASEMALNELDILRGNVPDNTGKFTVEPFKNAALEIEEKTGGAVSATAAHRWLTQGVDSALTEGQSSLGALIQMGTLFSDFVGNGVDEAMLGAVCSTVAGMMKNGVNTASMMVDMMRDGDWDIERLSLEASEQFTGYNSILRATSSISDDKILDRQGNTLINHPTFIDKISVAMSMTPGRVKTAYDLKDIIRRKTKATSEWMKIQAKEIYQTYQTNPDRGIDKYWQVVSEINNVDPRLTGAFNKAFVFNLHEGAQDLETRVYLDAVVGGYIDAETARVYGLDKRN